MFTTIIWATDGSEAADAALPYAKGLAEGPGCKLVVVHSRELLHGRAAGYPLYADEDGAVCAVDDRLRDAPEERLRERAAVAAADHDQLRTA